MNPFLEAVALNALVVLVLATVVSAVARFIRQPSVVYWLWFLVLVKLVTPPLVSVPLPIRFDQPAGTGDRTARSNRRAGFGRDRGTGIHS